MNDSTDDLERTLRRDLETLGDRFTDEKFAGELYRALAGEAWHKPHGPEGGLSLSWSRAERVVNDFRSRVDREPLTLAQTGGEGELDSTVTDELGRLGWFPRHRRTDRNDPRHTSQPAAGPDAGARGRGEVPEWERQAHEEADAR